MEQRAPWFVLGILLATSLLVTPLLAEVDEEAWERETRTVVFQDLPSGFRYESTRESDVGHDEILGTFSVENRRYVTTYLDKAQANMTPLRLIIDFEALLEYQDLDGDGAYGLGDRIIQRLRIAELEAPDERVETLPNGGNRVSYTYRLLPVGAADDKPGTFVLTLAVLPTGQQVGNEVVPPVQTRLQMHVTGFPFQSNSSLLAIENRVHASLPIQKEASSFYVESHERRLFYMWPGASTVDGAERPVRVTLLDSAASTVPGTSNPVVILHSYERGNDLWYEPVVGAARDDPQRQVAIVEFFARGDWRIYGVGFLVAFLLIGATLYRRMDRA